MKKKIILLLVGIFLFLFKTDVVVAAENDTILKREFIPNVWSFHYRDGKVWTYGQLNIKYMNGKLGYCIEPDSAINTDVYSSYTDWSVSKYNDYVKKRMELIAYYGYQFKGHQTIKYYMATQELIWTYCGDDEIIWTKSDSSDSERINIAHEKNEIIRLVNKHNLVPSFSNLSYKVNVGETLTLTDENKSLTAFDIKTDIDYKISGYNLSFVVPNKKEIKIDFIPRGRSYDSTIVYACNIRSQRIATFGPPSNIQSAYITVIPDKIKVNINKKDNITKNNITDIGNVIKLKNIDKNEYVKIDDKEELEISNDGTLSLYLEDGNYEIEEICASNGYSINKEKKIFNINKDLELDNYVYNVDFYNEKVYGKIKIKKIDENNNLLENCIFEIYDKNMELVDTVITTSKEYDESILLELGEYFVKEIKTIDGYELDNKVYKINLDYISGEIKVVEKELEIINKKIRCDVMFISLDDKDNPLDKVSINVYNSNDEIVYEGKTDENGEVAIDNITYGDYYLKQTHVPNGYELNEEKVEFTISDDCCLASLKLNNNKVDMPKTSTKNIDIISLVILIINLGIIKIVKKIN